MHVANACPGKCLQMCLQQFLEMGPVVAWILVDGCNPVGHPVLFCVVLKDRRAREGIHHAKPPKIVAYLGP